MFSVMPTRKLITVFLTLLGLVLQLHADPFSVHAKDQLQQNFVTLVYPVRGRDLWQDRDLVQLDQLLTFLAENELPSTWLFQYDALTDSELIDHIKARCKNCEFGVFSEVSENLATDAQVAYQQGVGPWYQPNLAFFSGYDLLARKKMADQLLRAFSKSFQTKPKTVGSWYLDPYTLNYLHRDYGVSGYVSVADQYDTDGQQYWGKPWGTPYYPQIGDIMVPASSVANKLDVVQIQWAQRDLVKGYGKTVQHSRSSFQANDYVNNGLETIYFTEIVKPYVQNNNPVNQITIGLEAGQELFSFQKEHFMQLNFLLEKQDVWKLHFTKVSNFVDHYREKFPDFSPTTQLAVDKTLWVNSACYRLGQETDMAGNEVVFDLRRYSADSIAKDAVRVDNDKFLSRNVPFEVDAVEDGRKVPLNSFSLDESCLTTKLPDVVSLKNRQDLELVKLHIKDFLSALKFSTIDDKKVIGLKVGPDEIIGYKEGSGFGKFSYPFQTLVNFKSLGSMLIK